MQAPWWWSKTEICRSDIYVYFHVNFNVFLKLIKVHFLVSELYELSLVSRHGKRIFSSLKCFDTFLAPPSLLFSKYLGYFPQCRGCWIVNLTTHLQLVKGLGISGSTTPLHGTLTAFIRTTYNEDTLKQLSKFWFTLMWEEYKHLIF